MNQRPADFAPVPDADIERTADLVAKHARERALLAGRHENERRQLVRMQQRELSELATPAAPEAVE